MRAFLKRSALGTMRALGVFELAANVRRRNSLVILCYHGISIRDEHEWAGGLYMTPAGFRERLQFLKTWGANVVGLQDGLRMLRERQLPPRSVVITFDDGFYDFYLHALPALVEFRFPSTLYLTTWYARHRVPVYNLIVNYLLWKSGDSRYADRYRREAEALDAVKRANASGLDVYQRDNAARGLAAELDIDYERILEDRILQIMTPAEIAECHAKGVDIQLHTHRHRVPVDRELFLREITDNRDLIRQMTGTEPQDFCYPSGVTTAEFLPWLREAGVQSATTCVHGRVTSSTDQLLLPRYLDGAGVTELDFEAWLAGIR